MTLILGSESIFRKQVLLDAGYEFEVIPAHLDEKEIRRKSAEVLTAVLAHAKGYALVERLKIANRKACVITADQVMECNGLILEKPQSRIEAQQQLKAYEDHNPKTVSALHIYNMFTNIAAEGVDVTEIRIAPFSELELNVILDDEITYLCCGSLPYGIPENRACEIVDAHQFIPEGKASSVIGMPLDLLAKLLERVKYEA